MARGAPERRGAVATVPNAVTLARLPLAAAFALAEGTGTRAAILVVAALSDGLDGWLARRLRQFSSVGEVLDPAVDKIFILVALVSFHPEQLEAWHLPVLLLRDGFAVVGAGLVWLAGLPIEARARFSGKVVTVLQMATVLVLLALPALGEAMVLAVGAASVYAIADYGTAGWRRLRGRSAGA